MERLHQFVAQRGLVLVSLLLAASSAVALTNQAEGPVGKSGTVTLEFVSGCSNPGTVIFAGHTWQSTGPTGGGPSSGQGFESGRFTITAKRRAIFVSDADHSRHLAFVRLDPALSQMPCTLE